MWLFLNQKLFPSTFLKIFSASQKKLCFVNVKAFLAFCLFMWNVRIDNWVFHKLWLVINPYIFAKNMVDGIYFYYEFWSSDKSFNCQTVAPGCKYNGIRKFQSVIETHFLRYFWDFTSHPGGSIWFSLKHVSSYN